MLKSLKSIQNLLSIILIQLLNLMRIDYINSIISIKRLKIKFIYICVDYFIKYFFAKILSQATFVNSTEFVYRKVMISFE